MKSKIIHYIKEILLFVVVMTIFANLISLYKSADLNNAPLDIKNITLINDKEYKIDTDKPVLVHFWATWCPTCKAEASNIDFIAKSFQVITVAVKSGKDSDIKDFLDTNSLNFMVINDKNGKMAQKFNIAAYPTTFIYDKDRKLVFSDVGYTTTWGLYLRMWWAKL
ncbi:MAG: redoxin domain-containing protein [Campylobacterota bacterium]|nr:redoxin domain-containing protein [Campylobacterota bacterium]